MALVSTICPECKASIKLDDSKPFGFCLSCGSKIALSTSQQNNSGPGADQLIANYSQLALNAARSGNHELAESYCNKIIELDPKNSAAWALKASAAGWQSTLRNIRLNEMIQNYITALSYANDEASRNTIRAKAKEDYLSIARGLLKNELGLFEKFPTMDVFSDICDFYKGINTGVPVFGSRIAEITVEEFYDNLAGETISTATRTLNRVIRDYNANSIDAGDMLTHCDAIAGIAGMAAIASSPAVQINCYDAQLSAKNTKLQVINQYAAYVNGSRQFIDQTKIHSATKS